MQLRNITPPYAKCSYPGVNAVQIDTLFWSINSYTQFGQCFHSRKVGHLGEFVELQEPVETVSVFLAKLFRISYDDSESASFGHDS